MFLVHLAFGFLTIVCRSGSRFALKIGGLVEFVALLCGFFRP